MAFERLLPVGLLDHVVIRIRGDLQEQVQVQVLHSLHVEQVHVLSVLSDISRRQVTRSKHAVSFDLCLSQRFKNEFSTSGSKNVLFQFCCPRDLTFHCCCSCQKSKGMLARAAIISYFEFKIQSCCLTKDLRTICFCSCHKLKGNFCVRVKKVRFSSFFQSLSSKDFHNF